MRTTLEIPEDVMLSAQEILGFKSKTDVVIHALREVIRRHKLDKLSEQAGKFELNIDLNASRKRPSKYLKAASPDKTRIFK